KLNRQADGILQRTPTPMVKVLRDAAASGEQKVGTLEAVSHPTELPQDQRQAPPIGELYAEFLGDAPATARAPQRSATAPLTSTPTSRISEVGTSTGNGNGKHAAGDTAAEISVSDAKETDRYGIVVFSHLRWGFVWQRPQQFLSRFAKKHTVLFIEEPFFDQAEGTEPFIKYHRVMPNVIVV